MTIANGTSPTSRPSRCGALPLVAAAGLTVLGGALLPTEAAAQVPCEVPLEAYVTDATGAPLDGPLEVELRFYNGDGEDAVAADCRVFDAVPLDNGWMRLSLDTCALPEPDGVSGCGVLSVDDLLDTNAALGDQTWIAISVDAGVSELSPRVPVGAVPYARQAGHALTCEEAAFAESLSPDGAIVVANLLVDDDLYADFRASLIGPPGEAGPQGIQGEIGPQGVAGEAGPQGIQGETGPQGIQGEIGPQGVVGEAGPQGIQGETGPQGIQGEIGPQGVAGEAGPQGIQGETGPAGPQGIQGLQGLMGLMGPQGIQGEIGPQGPQGEIGPAGPQGDVGPMGLAGPQGDVGPQGPQGPQGETGPVGLQGIQGLQGLMGLMGPQGDVGPEGPAGPQGLTGPAGADGATGPAGADGATGPQGPQGPAGADGATGPQGPQGPAGADGATGPQGPAGSDGVDGTDGATGPQGPQGPQGPAGSDGVDGTDGATGPQGPQGPQGPAGSDGATGPQGPQGPQGPAGSDGVDGADGADGAPGPAGPMLDANALCVDATGAPGFVFDGVCVLQYSSGANFTWSGAANACVDVGGDLCSVAEYAVLVNAMPTLFNISLPRWTQGFSDNDGGAKNAFIASSDDPTVSQSYGYACCGSLVPEPFASQTETIGGVEVTYIRDRADTVFEAAAGICAARGSDLCTQSQYVPIVDAGRLSVTTSRHWTNEMSDNDGSTFSAVLGTMPDNPNTSTVGAFACCAGTRPNDYSCPGTAVSGTELCVGTVETTAATFQAAARVCASEGANICTNSQMTIARENALFSTSGWTAEGADNDSSRVGGLLSSQLDNPTLTTEYGFVCCY